MKPFSPAFVQPLHLVPSADRADVEVISKRCLHWVTHSCFKQGMGNEAGGEVILSLKSLRVDLQWYKVEAVLISVKRNRKDERWCCLIWGFVPALNQESWTYYCERLRALKILHQEEWPPVGGRGSDLNLVCFWNWNNCRHRHFSAVSVARPPLLQAETSWPLKGSPLNSVQKFVLPRGLILTFPLVQWWVDGWKDGWPWHFVRMFMFPPGWTAITFCHAASSGRNHSLLYFVFDTIY